MIADAIFDLIEDRSLVGIGWHGAGNVRGMNRETILAKVREFRPRGRAGMVAGMLDHFANRIETGDTVITQKLHDQLALIGEITGEYTFNSATERPRLSLTRTVEWIRSDITYCRIHSRLYGQ